MPTVESLIEKFLLVPNDLEYREFKRVLNYFGYEEKQGKGSRVRFINGKKKIINLHMPHGRDPVPRYIIDQAIETLKYNGDLK